MVRGIFHEPSPGVVGWQGYRGDAQKTRIWDTAMKFKFQYDQLYVRLVGFALIHALLLAMRCSSQLTTAWGNPAI